MASKIRTWYQRQLPRNPMEAAGMIILLFLIAMIVMLGVLLYFFIASGTFRHWLGLIVPGVIGTFCIAILEMRIQEKKVAQFGSHNIKGGWRDRTLD